MEESDRSIGNIKTKGGPRPQANMFLPVDASENALLASVFTVEELIARLGLARGEVGDEGSHISLLLSFLGLARFGNFVRGNGPSQSVTGSPGRCGMIPYNKSRRESVSVSLQPNHAPSITTMKTSPTIIEQKRSAVASVCEQLRRTSRRTNLTRTVSPSHSARKREPSIVAGTPSHQSRATADSMSRERLALQGRVEMNDRCSPTGSFGFVLFIASSTLHSITTNSQWEGIL